MAGISLGKAIVQGGLKPEEVGDITTVSLAITTDDLEIFLGHIPDGFVPDIIIGVLVSFMLQGFLEPGV
jgi:hypothetical protein